MWWIIIGAVIALIVLVVLMVIFTSKTRILEGELLSCESKGGICVDPLVTSPTACKDACGDTRQHSSTFTCPKPDVSGPTWCCCLGVGDSPGVGDDSE